MKYLLTPSLRQLAAVCAVYGTSALITPALVAQTRSIAPASSNPDPRNLQVVASNATTANRNQRIALVIGNAAYKEAPLLNPVNDARAIGKALQDSGFTVILRENTDQRGMMSALREFGDKLRAGGVGIFYYAGHGMQIKGRNYLIPVGANVEREDEVAYSAVDAQAVLDKMEAAGNASNIMILDACRNNPFTRSTRSGQAGLAQMDAPVGTLVAFATSPGAVASDGAGSNGLYTQHLLDAMRKPGLKVEDVFKQVRANVRRDSQGKQVPWEATSLEGDFYFQGGAAGGGQQLDLEQARWDAVKDSKVPIELRAYLNRYPQGRFSQLARERLSTWSTVNQTTNQPTNATIRPPVVVVATDSKTDNNQRAKEAVDQLFNLPPPNTTSQRLASSSTTDDLQATVDQRTKELLDQLSNLQRPNTASTKPSAASSVNGFTVGDRWRFQTVDKYKKEVVENWARQIDRIEPDGSMRLNSGRVQWSSTGGLQRTESASGRLRTYSPEIPYIPRQLQNGWQQAVKFTLTWRNEDSQYGVEEREGKLTVLGRESVTVPAGTFDAWKVEMAGDAKGKNLVSNSNYYSTFKEVWWYVPALRYFVASEYEQRRSGQLESYVRYELTSYSVRGADEALAKR